MDNLRNWIESKQADLVNTLETSITACSDARPLTHRQLSALVLGLSISMDQGPAVLESTLRHWHTESKTDEPITGEWAISMAVIKDAIWCEIISEFSPVKALNHLRKLEATFASAITVAARLDAGQDIQLLERELQEEKRQLRQIDQSKANFINIAAHELKTPLTLIEGYANMLMVEIPEEMQARAGILLGGISNGTHRLQEIIDSMIDISLIDTQVLEISYQPIYLRQVTKMAARDLADVLRIRQIELTMDDFQDDGAPTYGDPGRLHQAMFNVLGNAIKFTPDGGKIHITNTTRQLSNGPENARGELEITISDTGIGIAPENLERIFTKFAGLGNVALHSTSKYKFKGGGPGLGLAITRGIVETHGGRIWAESSCCDEETLPGTAFHIVLPLLDAPPA